MITLQNLIPDFSKKLLLKAAAAASVLFLSVTLSAIPSFAASAYDNLAVANVTSEPLNMRTKPSTAGEIVGKCYRGAGGTVDGISRTFKVVAVIFADRRPSSFANGSISVPKSRYLSLIHPSIFPERTFVQPSFLSSTVPPAPR